MSFKRMILTLSLVLVLVTGTLVFAQDTEDLLSMSLDDLLNMEVTTASKSAEKLSDAPGVITVVTKDELQRFGGTTLKDILERVPSLIGSTAYFTDRSTIAVRGDQIKINAGHNLILINGRPTREIVEGGISTEMYEAFPVNIIERIEVIKGPGSVLYGSNAFSSVINIITEKAEGNGLNVTGLAGNSGAYGTMAKTSLQAGDFSVVAAGRYFKKADWETDYKYQNWFVEGFPITTSNVTIPNLGQSGYLEMDYKKLRFMSTFNQFETAYFSNGIVSDNRWQKGFADLGYSLQAASKWNMDFNVTYSYATMKADESPFLSRHSNDVVAEWTNFISPIDKLNITIGGLVNYIKGKEETTEPVAVVSDDNRTSYALYTQADYQLLSSMKVIGGFQANKVKDVDLDIVPRGGVIWYPIPRINVKALYSQAFRGSSINETSLNFPGFYGNPNLKPEKVSAIDVGMSYLGDQTQFGVNYFRNKQSNIIVPNFMITPAMYDNLGNVEFQGVEFEGKYYLTRAVFLTGSVLYQTNKDDKDVEDVTPIPNFGGKAGVSYMSENGITVSVFNIYQGGLEDKYISKLNPEPGVYNLLNLYSRLNINKFFDLDTHYNFAVFVQADNLLNTELWLPDKGGVTGETIPVNQGRAVYLGLDVSL